MASAAQSEQDIEDEILKKRLILDGNGQGEKRFRNFTQDYIRWVLSNNYKNDDTVEIREFKDKENTVGLQKLCLKLEHLKFLTNQSAEQINAATRLRADYADLKAKIKLEIDNHRGRMNERKENFEKERRLMEQKKQLEAMTQLVATLPDRKLKEEEIRKLTVELDLLKRKNNEIDVKITTQKERLTLLIECVKDLQGTLNENEQAGRQEEMTQMIESDEESEELEEESEEAEEGSEEAPATDLLEHAYAAAGLPDVLSPPEHKSPETLDVDDLDVDVDLSNASEDIIEGLYDDIMEIEPAASADGMDRTERTKWPIY